MDPIKLISFCIAKKTIHKAKRQPTDWEKIFANDVTNKSFIFKLYNREAYRILKQIQSLLPNGIIQFMSSISFS